MRAAERSAAFLFWDHDLDEPGLAAAAGVGLAVLAMYLTATFHPPAGINPLLVVSNNLPWSFLFAPVLAGALLLTAFAMSGTAGWAAGRGRSAGYSDKPGAHRSAADQDDTWASSLRLRSRK
jgi:CBS-domain-containing membrane protein